MSKLYQNINCKLVWVSDIHLRGTYRDSNNVPNKLQNLYEAFLNTIKVEEVGKPIDYFLLTGDIGFAGSEEDYAYFWDWFIVPLHEYYESLNKGNSERGYPKFIVIPGNHDISWGDTSHFKEYLKTFNSSEKKFKKKNKTLFDDTNSKEGGQRFFKAFISFTNRFGFSEKNEKNTIWNDFFNLKDIILENNVTITKYPANNYNTNRLFGYLKDDKNKIIFVLVNTAWYSIGVQFNTLLAAGLKKPQEPSAVTPEFIFDYYRAELASILEKKEVIVEYGNQIIGRDIFPIVELEKIISDNPEYVVITCMHHPLNWLNWNELYDYNNKKYKDFTLNKILDKSNILLTGHEHLPISQCADNIPPDRKGWHFKAGMFMEDQIDVSEDDIYFEHSRFSILSIETDIDKDESTVTENKYLYNREYMTWESRDKGEKKPLSVQGKQLKDAKIGELVKEVPKFNIKKFLADRLEVYESDWIFESIDLSDTNYIAWKCTYDKKLRICIIPTKESFSEILLPSPFPKDYFLDKILLASKPAEYEIVTIHFIWLDLLVNKELTNDYNNGGVVHFESFTKIYNYSDYYFNRFRHHYFDRFRSDNNQQKKAENQSNNPDFKSVKDLRFVNQPVPYWVFKKYCET